MLDLKNTTSKTCHTCLYLATHENCKDCLGIGDEVKRNNNDYLYSNWVEGDGVERIKQWEKEGKSNIVIGGSGEAEVNVKWTPDKTLEHLVMVSEQCGYLTTKGNWLPHWKEIYIVTEGKYRLTYWHDKLEQIDRIIESRFWTV